MARRRRSPNSTAPAPIPVRLLWALAACERLMQGTPGIAAGWALDHAATTHAVDRLALAELWLAKMIDCQLARAHSAAMNDADDA